MKEKQKRKSSHSNIKVMFPYTYSLPSIPKTSIKNISHKHENLLSKPRTDENTTGIITMSRRDRWMTKIGAGPDKSILWSNMSMCFTKLRHC